MAARITEAAVSAVLFVALLLLLFWPFIGLSVTRFIGLGH